MDTNTLLIAGGSICVLALIYAIFRNIQRKKKIERARELVKLYDNAQLFESMINSLPESYLNNRMKGFLLEQKVALMREYINRSGYKLEKQQKNLERDKDRLQSFKTAPPTQKQFQLETIPSAKAGNALKEMLKKVHERIRIAANTKKIKAKEARALIDDIKLLVFRINVDTLVSGAEQLQQKKNYGAAVARMRQALGYCKKHPSRIEIPNIESLIQEKLKNLENTSKEFLKEKRAQNEGKSDQSELTEGLEKLAEEEKLEQKPTLYDE